MLNLVGHSGALQAMQRLVNSFPCAGGTRDCGRQCEMGRDLLQNRQENQWKFVQPYFPLGFAALGLFMF